MNAIQEFKPSLVFLGKFLLIYIVCNSVYGFYVHSFQNKIDPITAWTSVQTCSVLSVMGYEVEQYETKLEPTMTISYQNIPVIRVFEGCNGVNVAIVFLAFLFAFGGPPGAYLWMVPLGLVIIVLSNFVRLAVLFDVALNRPEHFFYFHKYVFTAFLYFVVFVLWTFWIVKISVKTRMNAAKGS